MDHPTENLRDKSAAGCFALIARADGARQTEFRTGPGHLLILAPGRKTKIDVRMPLGNAQRHAAIELAEAGVFGRGVHDADDFVSVRLPAFHTAKRWGVPG